MKKITSDPRIIAYCGLYCGSCKRYLKETCPGCQQNEKASWCKVRKCCIENSYKSCADCTTAGHEDCTYFNNIIAKIFGIIFRSDRKKCIEYIKSNGYESFADYMSKNQLIGMKR